MNGIYRFVWLFSFFHFRILFIFYVALYSSFFIFYINVNGFNLNCKLGKTTCGALSKLWNPICKAFLKIPLILWFHKKINGTQWMVVPLDHSFACTIYLVLFRIEHLHLWPLFYNTILCFVWSPGLTIFFFLQMLCICAKNMRILARWENNWLPWLLI